MAVPFQIYLIQVEKQATYILKFPKNDGKRIHNLFEFVKSASKNNSLSMKDLLSQARPAMQIVLLQWLIFTKSF